MTAADDISNIKISEDITNDPKLDVEGIEVRKHYSNICFRMLDNRKTLATVLREALHDHAGHDSKYGLFDLLCIGIGSTIGSGVFVLTGSALPMAGPGAVVSWFIAGLICLLSSSSYMEMSARLPTKGSCYLFSYHALGELASVVGAVCLTMEYGISGSGVARNWSAKLMQLCNKTWIWCYKGDWADETCSYSDDYYLDPVAGLITAVCVLVLVLGVSMGKLVINTFTVSKMILVMFLIIAGLAAWQGNMFNDFFPTGGKGTLSATSSLFFGFIGFDEVCCMSSKAKDPAKTMPRALVGTLIGAALFSGSAQFALSAMVPWSDGMDDVPFELQFEQLGWIWAKWIVAIGELVLLPLVVLLSILPQPEVTAAMSEDGLLPLIFSRQNASGVYFQGTLICGAVFIVIAIAVPFVVLWDMISIGVLFSFNLTQASLVQTRYGNGGAMTDKRVNALVWLMVGSSAVAGYVLQQEIVMVLTDDTLEDPHVSAAPIVVVTLALLLLVLITFYIRCALPVRSKMENEKGEAYFVAPFVPFVQGLAMFLNFFLSASLTWTAHATFAGFVVVLFLMYFVYILLHKRTE